MTKSGRPEEMVGQEVPDLTLTADDGRQFPLRRHFGRSGLVLFFYIRNGTPG
jgi:peroxiredoxin